MGTSIIQINYDSGRVSYKGTDGIDNADLGEAFLHEFKYENNENIFYLPDKKEAINRIKDSGQRKEMKKAMRAFVKNNKEEKDYLVSW